MKHDQVVKAGLMYKKGEPMKRNFVSERKGEQQGVRMRNLGKKVAEK